MNYEDMLERAMEEVDNDSNFEELRLEIPEPQTNKDGSYTVYSNFAKTADTMDRDADELLTFFKEELATSASLSDGRARFKGEFSQPELAGIIDEFFDSFVQCNECGSPDTRYEEQSGVMMIRCTACGASRPKQGSN